jgi:2-polyprenyl-3-methyl-5-hydroxy-6-metoxy-1,4-benzoquinol methylase
MVIHKLIAHHRRHKDDKVFYQMQAVAAIDWMVSQGVEIGQNITVLDLGCGHGVFGHELLKRGCAVTFSDEENTLSPEISKEKFVRFNIDQDDMRSAGKYDLVICSNVYEHLAKPEQFLRTAHQLLKPKGVLYLSWTNWLSPWGGHEFSPFHYLGVRRGHLIFDRLTGRKRKHTPYENLYPTYIGQTLRLIQRETQFQVVKIAPRYYTELSFLMVIPLVREFLSWNCAVLLRAKV